ncbi:MAG: hypothetical protein ABEJ61_08120 [Haloferacaceae archaeon]
MTRRGRDAGPARDRGQSTIDYGIGAVLFVLTVAFVLAFTPTLLGPFVGGAEDDYATADRVADQLSTDLLGEPSQPYVLDEPCTNDFFDGNFGTAGCRHSGTTLNEALGLNGYTSVYVALVDLESGSDTVVKSIGQAPGTGGEAVASASRQVMYDGTQHQLLVKVW